MSGGRSSVSWIPTDLVAVAVTVGLANLAVFHPVLSELPLRAITGLLFVLFVPGYALVAALFPEAGRSPGEEPTDTDDPLVTTPESSDGGPLNYPRGVDGWERLALSFAFSLAAIPLLAMGVTLSSLSFTTVTTFLAISAFTILCAGIGAWRRLRLHPQRRFRVSPTDWLGRTRSSSAGANSRGAILLNIALAIAILVALGVFGFAVLAPPDGETYTDFHILSEDESGDLVAAAYPDSFTPQEPEPIYTGIENHEHRTVEYDVVVQLQRVQETEDGAVVTDRQEVDRFSVVVEPGESWVDRRNLTASDSLTGSDLRLQFMLYRDGAPETSDRESAYRNLHLWVDIEDPDRIGTTPGSDGPAG